MYWRSVVKLWIVLAVLAAPPVLFYSFEHGLCDTTTCGSDWLTPVLFVLMGVGVFGTALVGFLRRGKT